jgi:hypothetical protein
MYALTVMEYRGDREMRCGEIDIPTEIFQAMQKKANAADDTAFTELLARGLAEMTKPEDSCALENAVAANNALVQLLAEHMELERHDSGVSSFTGLEPEASTLCFGVFQLMQICRANLNAAAEVAA